jgi:molybdate/tungstate transport system ATP-binding protein
MLNPRALLLDEPLSALDQMFRDDARRLLKTLHQELNTPFILVSHSFSEVLFLANKGAVIKQGRMQQSGSIEDLFERPASSFVAAFVGMSNIFPCRVFQGKAHLKGLTLQAGPQACSKHTHLAVRPEEVRLAGPAGSTFANNFKGRILHLDCQGFYYRAKIRIQAAEFEAYWTRHEVEEGNVCLGQEVNIAFPASAVHTFADPDADRS